VGKHRHIYKNRNGWIFQKGGFQKYLPTVEEAIEYRNEYLGCDPDDPSTLNVCLFDIETSPILAYVWGLWDQNIGLNQVKDDWYLLSMAWKWLDEKKVHVLGLPDAPFFQYEKPVNRNDERWLVWRLWEVLNDADVVVAHNAARFDVKRMQAKFFEYNLSRPSNFKIVDTLKIAKANFAFTSNKLDYISQLAKGPGKIDSGGFETWLGCMAGDEKAWAKMLKYNGVDLEELERIYLLIRGWDKSAPNIALVEDFNEMVCPTCGSRHMVEAAPTRTSISVFPTYRCTKCGQLIRERKSTAKNKLVNAR
jgi:predicted RNA-binding Zn-ribbon protein involved in translation (DUF1610 family)